MLRKSIVFFKQINEAFTRGDTDFIKENFTEDVEWTVAGKQPVKGIHALVKAVEKLRDNRIKDLAFVHFITHGNKATINGTMSEIDKSGKLRNYSFCHIYQLNKFKNGKVKNITSYVVETD